MQFPIVQQLEVIFLSHKIFLFVTSEYWCVAPFVKKKVDVGVGLNPANPTEKMQTLPIPRIEDTNGAESNINLLLVTKIGQEIHISKFIELILIKVLNDDMFECSEDKISVCTKFGRQWMLLRKHFFKNPKHSGTQFRNAYNSFFITNFIFIQNNAFL